MKNSDMDSEWSETPEWPDNRDDDIEWGEAEEWPAADDERNEMPSETLSDTDSQGGWDNIMFPPIEWLSSIRTEHNSDN